MGPGTSAWLSVMTDSDTDPFAACAHCGTAFQEDVSYPVATQQKDGELALFSFCDEACRAAWAATDRE